MRFHVHFGLQLDAHHADMALATGRRQGEGHARIDLLVVFPLVNLWLVKD